MPERHILLAENNLEHAAHILALLKQLHYSVEFHQDGIAALQRLQDPNPPEMALLSSSLTPVSGIDVGLEIRRRSRRRKLWLMLMSDTPSATEVSMATEAGIDEFLLKPVDFQELRMRISTGERVQSLYRELSDSAFALEFYSTHDPLTGTWRRESMLDLLFKETDRVQRLKTPASILLIHIDGFEMIAQRRGHNDADKLLKMLANRLRHQLRSYDMLGRYAEDQFLIALPGCLGADAEVKAERILQFIARRPFMVEGNEIFLTVSIGIAESLGRSPLIVLREAERAVSAAKQQGKSTVRYACDQIEKQSPTPQLRRRQIASS